MWLIAVLPVESVGILLLASLGWVGLGIAAAVLAVHIGCGIYISR